MNAMVAKIRRIGWLTVEAGLLVILLCVVLDIILGAAAGSFVASVAGNTTRFLQALPPGVLLGVVLIVVVWGFVKARLEK